MKYFVCILFFIVYHGTVFCDENCDNSMRGNVENYAHRVSSSDLIVCFEVTNVKCGEEYAPALLEKRPTLYFNVGMSCNMVTIMFFGNYTGSTKLLWLAYNVPASDLKSGFHGQSGNERVIYKMPPESPSTTNHFFFVYCQGSEMESFKCCSIEERENANIKELSEKNSLNPVSAAMFFQVTATDQLMDKEPDKDGVCGKR